MWFPLTGVDGCFHLVTWGLLEGVGPQTVWRGLHTFSLHLNAWMLTVLGLQDLEHHITLSLFVLICGVANSEHNY